jgi:DNA-binding HxlR family transcriptional regulator
MERYKQYANRFPKEIRLAVSGLQGQNELRFAIVAALLENENGESFSNIKDELDVHQQRLSTALDDLQTAGIIKKQADGEVGGRSTGKYCTTEFAHRILDGFYAAMEPKRSDYSPQQNFFHAKNVTGESVLFGGWNVERVQERTPVESTEIKTTEMNDHSVYGQSRSLS